VRRFPSNEGVKEGYPLRNRYFAVINSSSVRRVADRRRLAAYHNKHRLRAYHGYQHRWLWTTLNFKNSEFYSVLVAILGCDAYFKSELRRNHWIYAKRTCGLRFSALNVDCNSLSFDPFAKCVLLTEASDLGTPFKTRCYCTLYTDSRGGSTDIAVSRLMNIRSHFLFWFS